MRRAVLMLIAASLTFVGPTYVAASLKEFGVPHPIWAVVGLSFFATGLTLFYILIKKR